MTVQLDWRDYSADSMPPLLRSAVKTFVEQGYHGTTTRTLAADAGLSVPGLYHHFSSKQSIIVAIMQYAMDDLWGRSTAALVEAGDDTQRRLELHVECLVLFHAFNRDLAFLAASEIRSLEPDARLAHIAARDRQERLLDDIVARGQAEGVFADADRRQVARAVITMCTGVSQWFSETGPLRAEEVAALYVVLARRMLARGA